MFWLHLVVSLLTLTWLVGLTAWVIFRPEMLTLKRRKAPEDITEILIDFKVHGYSIVRIDPDMVFIRGPRER